MATKSFMLQSSNDFSQHCGWAHAETPDQAAELYCRRHFEEPDTPIIVTGAGGNVTHFEPSNELRVEILLDRAKEWDRENKKEERGGQPMTNHPPRRDYEIHR